MFPFLHEASQASHDMFPFLHEASQASHTLPPHQLAGAKADPYCRTSKAA